MSLKATFQKVGYKIIILVLLLVLLGGLSFTNTTRLENEVRSLESTLSSFLTLPVEVSGSVYIISDGQIFLSGTETPLNITHHTPRILRLAYISVLERIDPLFGIEGSDIEALRRSVDGLRNSQNDISQLFPSYPDSETIKRGLYPISFLDSLANTEEARQEFIENPSYGVAYNYYKSLSHTIDSYISYIDTLLNIHTKAHIKSKGIVFTFVGGTSSDAEYIRALITLRSEANEKKVALKKRLSCLHSFTSACPTPTESLEKITDNSESHPEWVVTVTDTITRNASIIREYNAATRRYTFNEIVVLDKSRCFSNMGAVLYQAYSPFNPPQKTSGFNISFLNDIYFYDTAIHKDSYLSVLYEKGQPYLYQSPSRLYMCPEIGDDISRVSFIYAVKDTLATHLTATYSDPTISNLERTILNSSLIKESDVQTYIASISRLLNEKGEVSLAQEIGADNVLQLEKLIIYNYQKSSSVERFVETAVLNNVLIETLLSSGSRIDINGLFLSRNYPSLLLLTHNKSISSKPMHVLNSRPLNLDGFKFKSYNNELRHEYAPRSIVQLMIKAKNTQKEVENTL